MRTVNMHEAKTHFSRLVAAVEAGESIVIAKAGHPVAKLTSLSAAELITRQRIGFLTADAVFPDDIDSFGADEIDALFTGKE